MAKRSFPETSYERWIREEGVPSVTGHGVENILDLPRQPWRRMGGKGTYIKLIGMEGMTGMYVAEIPPGGALNPEKHVYEELVYVLQGRGSAELASRPDSPQKLVFEWQQGSLFAIPLNTWHRLYNGSGSESAIFLGFTNAPMIMDLFHRPEFVLNLDYVFDDRFDGAADYFNQTDDRYETDYAAIRSWDTNFVPDVRSAVLDPGEYKVRGRQSTMLEMGGGVLVTHIAQWPGGRHDKAHHHAGGAVLLVVRGTGYSLMWPQSAGVRPYESGNGDKVVQVHWKEGSIFSPPTGWFHQHFNTGSETTRHLALRYGTRKQGVEFQDSQKGAGSHISIRQGGTLIEFEDQDPEISRIFEAECARKGTPVQMARVGVA